MISSPRQPIMKLQRITNEAHHTALIHTAKAKRTTSDVASEMLVYVSDKIEGGKLTMKKVGEENAKNKKEQK